MLEERLTGVGAHKKEPLITEEGASRERHAGGNAMQLGMDRRSRRDNTYEGLYIRGEEQHNHIYKGKGTSGDCNV